MGGTLKCCDVTGVGKALRNWGFLKWTYMSSNGGGFSQAKRLQRAAAGADEGAGQELSTHTACSAAGQLLRDYCPLGCPAGFSKVTLLEDCFWPRVIVYGGPVPSQFL